MEPKDVSPKINGKYIVIANLPLKNPILLSTPLYL